MRDSSFDDEQLVLFEPVPMLLEELVEHGQLDTRVAVVQQHDGHAPAPRHLYALTVNDAGEQHGMRLRRELIEPRPDEARELLLVALERMAREIETQRELLVLEPLSVVPSRARA